MDHPDSAKWGERISGIDARVESLTSDLTTLTRSVSELRDTINRSFSLLSDRIAESGKPNMSTMAAWAGIVLGIVSMAGGIVYTFTEREVSKINAQLNVITASELENAYDKGLYTERLNSQVRAFESRVLIEDREFVDMDVRRSKLESDVKRNTERSIESEQQLDALRREVLRADRDKS